MRGTGVGVITAFNVPQGAPAPVTEAMEEFNRIGDHYGRLAGELEDAEAALEAARAEDVEAAAAAYAEGRTVEDATARERTAQGKVAALRTALKGAEVAADRAGDALLTPISEAREAWLAEAERAEEEAASRYDEAVAEARAALDALGKARSAVTWLRGFDANVARAGEYVSYLGKSEPIFAESLRGHKEDVRALLALAAEATAPEPLAYGDPRRAAVAEEVA